MKQFIILITALLFLMTVRLTGQSSITGTVIDQKTEQPVEWANVVVRPFARKKILGFAQTDAEGKFSIRMTKDTSLTDFTIGVSHLGYASYENRLVLVKPSDVVTGLTITLAVANTDLGVVTVRAKSPIIVRPDTIIYDVTQYASKFDDDLQGVLSRLPGFEVRPGGVITVNGQLIRKVLVNGEELPTSDPSLLTKSIPADFVAKVTVRFDEKNRKVKDNVLEDAPFAVLDIQMKDGIRLDLFGKATASLSTAESIRPGGYGNFFSIGKKVRWHIFGEHDEVGDETIDLMMLENIGDAAFASQLKNSDNVRDYARSEGYQLGFFGSFKQYDRRERSLAGVAGKWPLGKSDLYFGSYSFRVNGISTSGQDITSVNGAPFSWRQSQPTEELFSLNKLDYRYVAEKVKLRINGGLRFSANNRQLNLDNPEGADSFYQQEVTRQNSGWVSGSAELGSGKLGGTTLKYDYSLGGINWNNDFRTRDGALREYLGLRQTDEFDLSYDDRSDFRRHLLRANTFRKLSDRVRIDARLTGVHEFQKRQNSGYQRLSGGREEDIATLTTLPVRRTRMALTAKVGLEYRISGWRARLRGGWATEKHLWTNKYYHLPVFLVSLKKSTSGYDHLELFYERSSESFDLGDMLPMHSPVNNQLITAGVPEGLAPTVNHHITVSAGKVIRDLGLRISTYSHYHRTNDGYAFRLIGEDSPLIIERPVALANDLAQMSLRLVKTFRGSRLKITLLPYFVAYGSEVPNTPEGEADRTNGRSMDVSCTITSERREGKHWSFSFAPKFSHFSFGTRNAGLLGQQQLLWLPLRAERSFFKDRLLASATFTHVGSPNGTGGTDRPLLGLRIQLPSSKHRIGIVAENLLGAEVFKRHLFSPYQWSTSRSALFGRYVKVFASFKIH
jgi:hypothetical protein